MRYAFIQAHRHEWPVGVMCELMAVSVSGYYAWQGRPESEREQANQVLSEAIQQTWERSRKTYGSPRMHQQLNQDGVPCGRHRVARLMREHGLKARSGRGYTPHGTDSRHDSPIAANVLNQEFTANAPNEKWVCDMTFIATQEGWLYLAVVMDLFSRRIIGWAMSTACDAALVMAALHMAQGCRHAPPGVLVHSDRGSQYASQDHRDMLNGLGFLQSMSRTGNCYDNAAMESFFSTLKFECANHKEGYLTRALARTDIFDYIEVFYNRLRLHSSLSFNSPIHFEQAARLP